MAPGKTYTGPFPSDLGMSGHLDGGGAVDDGNSVEPIAIVGLSLKFPQDATSSEAFWNMILEKRCAMTEIPSDRMNVDAFQGTDPSRNDTVSIFYNMRENEILTDICVDNTLWWAFHQGGYHAL